MDNATDGGALDRRGFLRIGGLAIAGAALLASCGSDDESGSTAEDAVDKAADTDTIGGDKASPSDITLLRTASSLELAAVDVYQRAIDTGLLSTTPAEVAKTFQEQHKEHAEFFQGATKKLGGEVFEDANPEVLRALEPTLARLNNEQAVLQLVLDIETAAAATYVAAAGTFDERSLNQAVMSVGGVQARHVAVLHGLLGRPQAAVAFAAADGGLAPGTGV